MSCEQKDERFTLRFLDCDCTCCGIRQRYVPSVACNMGETQFQQLVRDISKPKYGLDCDCVCGNGNLPSTAVDPCACPNVSTPSTPIQVNFSVDTGVKQLSKTS